MQKTLYSTSLMLILLLSFSVKAQQTNMFERQQGYVVNSGSLNSDLPQKNLVSQHQGAREFQNQYGLTLGMSAYVVSSAADNFEGDNLQPEDWNNVVMSAALSSLSQYALSLADPRGNMSNVSVSPIINKEGVGVAVSVKF
ncbi:hypothetical protein [Vibrio viridaestus]|uniref:Uncharacterized protein n=1 Tax=Vibrio viridaestus TaxID=2487322 RepID=A0A3N9TET3_9VIBR|nr:hypothetical protein [Vibrio viridaestus]RQW62741.1 hypothetical protein EES38_13525 [Vibrio viridaestus]